MLKSEIRGLVMQTFKKSFVPTSVKIQKSIFSWLYGLLHNHVVFLDSLIFTFLKLWRAWWIG